MSPKTEHAAAVPCDRPTRDWYAWNNLIPPKPDDFHVVGEVQVSNPGVVAQLRPKEPQDVSPEILLMDLTLVQQPGIWPQVKTWAPIRYDKVLKSSRYRSVEVFSEEGCVAQFDVDDVH